MSIEDLFIDIVGADPVIQGLAGGIAISFLNFVGATIVLIWRNPTEKWLDAALGFAAGVMLSASFTSLLLPGIEFAARPEYRALQPAGIALIGIVPVLIGFFMGVIVLDRGEQWVHYVGPIISNRLVELHDGYSNDRNSKNDRHPDHDSGGSQAGTGALSARVHSVLLFTVAITLHNMPEGLAVGVGFGSGELANGISLMFAIGIQNIPEGLAVSVAAINAGLGRRWYAAIAGIRAGLVEIPLALFGAWAVTVAAPVLPYAMGFAAGGMLYVIGDQIIPETHSRGYQRVSTLGLMVGAALMLALDVVLS